MRSDLRLLVKKGWARASGASLCSPTTGEDDFDQRLKHPIWADVDEVARATLHFTISHRLDSLRSGKITAKLTSYYGDGVLKVYTLGGRD